MLVSPDDANKLFHISCSHAKSGVNEHGLKFTRGSHANPQQITTVSEVSSSAQAEYK